MQTAVLTLVIVAAGLIGFVLESDHNVVESQDRVLAAATSIAADPFVVTAIASDDPTTLLQPSTERLRATLGVDFITIMSPERIRWTHPTPSQIGQTYLGTVDAALAGTPMVEEYTGTLGPSVRAVAPVLSDGRIVGLVSVGITVERLSSIVLRSLPVLAALLAGMLLVGALVAVLVARWVRRRTRGGTVTDIEEALTARQAVVQSMTEGLVHIDERHQLRLVNGAAAQMLGLAPDVSGSVENASVQGTLRELLMSGRTAVDETHLVAESLLVVNQRPVTWGGRSYGWVATLRDHTELRRMEGDLATTGALADALAAQAHEAANRLHTVVMLVETGRTDEALDYATEQLELSHRLTESIAEQVDHPIIAALLLGKASQAAERGVDLIVDAEGEFAGLREWLPDSDIVTLLGNLVDNSIEATAPHHARPVVRVELTATSRSLQLIVSDNGPGIPADAVDQVLQRGWSTKSGRTGQPRGIGLSLVDRVAGRHHGHVEIRTSIDGGAEIAVVLDHPVVVPV